MKSAIKLLRARVLMLVLMVLLAATGTVLFGQDGTVQAMRADAQTGIALPVIMYHSVLRDPQRSGEYVITPVQFERDMLYLKDHGYEAVLPQDIIRYANGDSDLPEKPVLITFDDGYYNNLVYVLPILQRLQMKAAISIVGSYTDTATERLDPNPTYAHMTWEDISLIASSGCIEIVSHSYNLHTSNNGREGVRRKQGESEELYVEAIMKDIETQNAALMEHCGISTTVFVYPFGQWDKYSEALLRKIGFDMTLTCRERMNYIERNSASLFRLGRYNRPSGISTEQFMKKVLKG